MAIVRIDPERFEDAPLVQIDSDASKMSAAIEEVEDWGWAHGLVRTHERTLRPVLVDGKMYFRGICYRISKEERAAMDLAQQQMIERAESLRGVYTREDRRSG